KPLDALAVLRVVVYKDAVRKLCESFAAARDAKQRLHAIVVGREILIADGPVLAETVMIFAFELVVAHPPGRPAPHQPLTANEADAHPVVRVIGAYVYGFCLSS